MTLDWQDDAACLVVAPTLWHPDGPSRKVREKQEAQAKAVCNTCPVRDQCLEHALKDAEPHGIWGGLTVRERKQVARERANGERRMPAHMRPQPINHGTHAGYATHRRRGEEACEACRDAHNLYTERTAEPSRCDHCGNTFQRRQRKDRPGRFCSHSCASQAMWVDGLGWACKDNDPWTPGEISA